MKTKLFIVSLLISLFLITSSHAAWESGKRHRWLASCTTGGTPGCADAISGNSMGQKDTLNIIDMSAGPSSGATVYWLAFYDSGTTVNVENDPWRIVPDSLQIGGDGLTGTSTWAASSTGVSLFTAAGLATFLSGLSTTQIQFADGTTLSTGDLVSGNTDWQAVVISGDAEHDNFSDFVGDEHFTAASTGHISGTTDHSTDHESGGDWPVDHDVLTNFASNEHFTAANAGHVSGI